MIKKTPSTIFLSLLMILAGCEGNSHAARDDGCAGRDDCTVGTVDGEHGLLLGELCEDSGDCAEGHCLPVDVHGTKICTLFCQANSTCSFDSVLCCHAEAGWCTMESAYEGGCVGSEHSDDDEPDDDWCIATGETCTKNGDCCGFFSDDALCVDSSCAETCGSDQDCEFGYACSALVDGDGNPVAQKACLPGSGDGGGGGGSNECNSNSDCGSKKICSAGSCKSVQCTSDAHCSGCNRCVSNYCSPCGSGPYGCYC